LLPSPCYQGKGNNLLKLNIKIKTRKRGDIMGRYYNGDIEGKFWFGVQPSDDASFFGGEEQEPGFIRYYFGKEHLPEIKDGLKKCLEELGVYKKPLDDFFAENNMYSDETLRKQLDVTEKTVRELLEWYARYELGKKIEKCVKENGSCEFDAEL
jgi:hypothetical protein